jgi:oligopeptide transport system ATP-binding protein
LSDYDVLVRVENLSKFFATSQGIFRTQKSGVLKAVDGISFEIMRGETLGFVGESGCGKSTTGRAILQLNRPVSGKVYFEQNELTFLSDDKLRSIRPEMQMIFQDSHSSLNPRHSARTIISEPLVIHGMSKAGPKKINERVDELFNLVGLDPACENRFPHEFSGGQRQRIGIARALALNPKFIVCDEPISSLDVSIQAQIINLLQDLQEKLGLTYLFIAHDLSMVRHISNRVAVMYLGKIMELLDRNTLFESPLHPYTRSLISAVPVPKPKVERKRQRIILKGEVPSPSNPPSGCVFNTRCPLAEKLCFEIRPEYRQVYPGHFVSCHLVNAK